MWEIVLSDPVPERVYGLLKDGITEYERKSKNFVYYQIIRVLLINKSYTVYIHIWEIVLSDIVPEWVYGLLKDGITKYERKIKNIVYC